MLRYCSKGTIGNCSSFHAWMFLNAHQGLVSREARTKESRSLCGKQERNIVFNRKLEIWTDHIINMLIKDMISLLQKKGLVQPYDLYKTI